MRKFSAGGLRFPSEIAFHTLLALYFQVMLNRTPVTEFLLLPVTDIQVLQPVLFVVFLAIYIVNLAANGAILMVVISDSRLHSPLYFFLGNLSSLDICIPAGEIPLYPQSNFFLGMHKPASFLPFPRQHRVHVASHDGL